MRRGLTREGDVGPTSPGAAAGALSRREALAVAGASALALLLRLPWLGHSSLWLDEMWSIGTARLPWRALIRVMLHQDSNASLYYALLHGWLRLGAEEGTARLLSVLAGVATVPALYALGKRLAGPRAGLAAALLLAVNGYHLQFSQEARAYTLLVLLATLSTLFLVRAVEEPRGPWWPYVLATSLGIYTHAFAGLLLPAHALALGARRRAPWRAFLASAAAVVALALPAAWLLVARMREPNAPLGWVPRPSPRSVGALFWFLSGNPGVADAPSRGELLLGVPVLAACAALCLAALAGAARRGGLGRGTPSGWHLPLLLSLLIVPAGIVLAVSLRMPIFVSKYLLAAITPLALLTAVGIESLPRRTRGAALGLALAAAALPLPGYYRFRAHNEEWRAATRALLDGARPGDGAIFLVAPGRLLFEHYRRASGRAPAELQVLYPPERDERTDPAALAYLPELPKDLAEEIARHDRLWLVLFHDEFEHSARASQAVRAALAPRYSSIEERRFDGFHERVRLLLYARAGRQARAAGSAPEREQGGGPVAGDLPGR